MLPKLFDGPIRKLPSASRVPVADKKYGIDVPSGVVICGIWRFAATVPAPTR